MLLERHEPGAGTSSGNAGVIANYACIPLGTPSVLKSLPRLLFDPASPLSISLSALPQLMPWLLRFARASLPARACLGALFLSQLLENSLSSYAPIIDVAGTHTLLNHKGALHIFRRTEDLEGIAWDRQLRNEFGIAQTVLDRKDLAALEPALPPLYECALFYPDAAHLSDPLELMRLLTRAFLAMGGRIVPGELAELTSTGTCAHLTGTHGRLRANSVVIALGAWSALFARQLGDHIPLEVERGYHVEFPTVPALSRPVCPIELGFYLTPMRGRLRAAGTVELSRIHHPATPRSLQLIERGTRKIFPQLGSARSSWLGYRPSLPDSLPVIGRSPRAGNIIYAFGHGHLGVTLAAETSRLVSNMIAGRDDAPELLAAVSASRFCSA